MIFYLV